MSLVFGWVYLGHVKGRPHTLQDIRVQDIYSRHTQRAGGSGHNTRSQPLFSCVQKSWQTHFSALHPHLSPILHVFSFISIRFFSSFFLPLLLFLYLSYFTSLSYPLFHHFASWIYLFHLVDSLINNDLHYCNHGEVIICRNMHIHVCIFVSNGGEDVRGTIIWLSLSSSLIHSDWLPLKAPRITISHLRNERHTQISYTDRTDIAINEWS